jgi:hypothetical protein
LSLTTARFGRLDKVGIVQAATPKLHWNYFLALERDLEVASRYVEFTPENYDAYSIELAHLLFAAASEADVVAKLLCAKLDPAQNPDSITGYKPIVTAGIPTLTADTVHVPRYGLTLTPWDQWGQNDGQHPHPYWWSDYNKVKHQRDAHFKRATLKNALNAMGGLLLLAVYYYRYTLSQAPGSPLPLKDTTDLLLPTSALLRLPDDAYRAHLLLE